MLTLHPDPMQQPSTVAADLAKPGTVPCDAKVPLLLTNDSLTWASKVVVGAVYLSLRTHEKWNRRQQAFEAFLPDNNVTKRLIRPEGDRAVFVRHVQQVPIPRPTEAKFPAPQMLPFQGPYPFPELLPFEAPYPITLTLKDLPAASRGGGEVQLRAHLLLYTLSHADHPSEHSLTIYELKLALPSEPREPMLSLVRRPTEKITLKHG